MTRLVTDASAIAAIAFGEPEGETLAATLEGATLFAPTLARSLQAALQRER